jgi:hypothetical protein
MGEGRGALAAYQRGERAEERTTTDKDTQVDSQADQGGLSVDRYRLAALTAGNPGVGQQIEDKAPEAGECEPAYDILLLNNDLRLLIRYTHSFHSFS